MNLAETVEEEITSEIATCPICTRWRAKIYAIPVPKRGNMSKCWMFAEGCIHARALEGPLRFGLWESREDLIGDWNEEAARLRALGIANDKLCRPAVSEGGAQEGQSK